MKITDSAKYSIWTTDNLNRSEGFFPAGKSFSPRLAWTNYIHTSIFPGLKELSQETMEKKKKGRDKAEGKRTRVEIDWGM